MPNAGTARDPSSARRRILATLAAAASTLLLFEGHAVAGSWDHLHGDAANTGFATVITAPASLPARRVTGIGQVPPGAGPVIGPDGTVYVVNLPGLLKAFSPAGDQKWKRDTPGRQIVASPVVGADGAIYVVGTRMSRDHRSGQTFTRYDATLFKFTAGGGLLWSTDFPDKGMGTGLTSASPNIWRGGGTEVVMVPVFYTTVGDYELHLLAFSTSGPLMFDQKVTAWSHGDVTSEADTGSWDAFCNFIPVCMNKLLGLDPVKEVSIGDPPMPSVAVASSGGGPPIVVVADNYQYLVGYSFSPASGFKEVFRRHLNTGSVRMSSPAMLRDGHSAIRGNGPSEAWVLFGGPNVVEWPEVKIPLSGATPTLTVDGRIVMVNQDGDVTVIDPSRRRVINSVSLSGSITEFKLSIAPASASCSHVFVSTTEVLATLDAKAGVVVEQFFWRGGGVTSPAIGADGTVYALAGDTLHIFAPPSGRPPGPAWFCRSAPAVNPPGLGGGILTR
jgi:outer membrane protein assembly factor BamB